MEGSRIRGTKAALLAALAGAGCSSSQGAAQPVPSPQGEPAGVRQAQADSVWRPYAEADIHFMSGMITHHAQAILMSGWAPTNGASAAVLRLAERIINAQQDEIAIMQQWLRDRRQPVPEANATGMKLSMGGMEQEMLMPGMLSHTQLMQLDAARGAEFDRLFLSFMIQHHKGALAMVKDLFGSYGAGQDQTVFKFASDVAVDQSTEIARMEKLLAAVLTSPE